MTVQEILDELDDHGFDDQTVTRKLSAVNDAYYSICTRFRWPFMTTQAAPTTDVNGTIIAPTDIERLLSARVSGSVVKEISTETFYRQIAEGGLSDLGRNLISNGDFETNTTGWTLYSVGTLNRFNTIAKFGNYSLTFVPNNTTTQQGVVNQATPVEGGKQVTFSVWAYLSSGQSYIVEIYPVGGDGATVTGQPSITTFAGNDKFTRYSTTTTLDPSTRFVNVYVISVFGQNAGSNFVWIDGAKLEYGPAPTPFDIAPQYYYNVGGTYRFWPVPEPTVANRTGSLFYLRRPNKLVQADAEAAILFPPAHHRAIVAGALSKLYTMSDDLEAAAQLNQEFEAYIQRMAGELLVKPRSEPRAEVELETTGTTKGASS